MSSHPLVGRGEILLDIILFVEYRRLRHTALGSSMANIGYSRPMGTRGSVFYRQ